MSIIHHLEYMLLSNLNVGWRRGAVANAYDSWSTSREFKPSKALVVTFGRNKCLFHNRTKIN